MGKNKRIFVPSAAGRKVPAVSVHAPPDSFADKRPKFSFVYLNSGDYGLGKCQAAEKAAILDTLCRLSQCTWGEIWSAAKSSLGAEPLPPDAYKRLPVPEALKARKFIVFRFSQKGRLIGFHEADTFYLVFFDRNHNSY